MRPTAHCRNYIIYTRCCLVIALFIQQYSYSQSYIFQHLTTKEGLASEFTKYIFQDSKGFYWIGYDNGFQRFDGKNFVTSSFDARYIVGATRDLPATLPVEDKAGSIYIFNQGSVFVFHLKGNVDTIRIFDDQNKALASIVSVCRDEQDNIWLATPTNLYRYDKQKKQPIQWVYTGPRRIISSPTRVLYDSTLRSIWLAKDSDLFLIDPATKQITQPLADHFNGNQNAKKNSSFTNIYLDRNRNLWVAAWDGSIYKYNTANFTVEEFTITSQRPSPVVKRSVAIGFAEDNEHKIWIGSASDGLFVYEPTTGIITTVPTNNNDPIAFHYDNSVFLVYTDLHGNIWSGTDRGFNIVNPLSSSFHNINEKVLGPLFGSPSVTNIFQSGCGDIYVSSWGKGWLYFDKEFTLKKHFVHSLNQGKLDPDNRENFAWCFAEDHDGKIWIGFQYGLVGIFDPSTKQLKYINPPEFNRKSVMSVACDANGDLWFGLYSGDLVKRRSETGEFTNYGRPSGHLNAASGINDILVVDTQNIWIASGFDGFYRFDASKQSYAERYYNLDNTTRYDNSVYQLTKLDDTTIAVCTMFRGLLFFNTKTKTSTVLDADENMPLFDVTGVAKDQHDNLWIATRQGLWRASKERKKIIVFHEEDGLLLKKFQGNITVMHNGTMAIPAENGFLYFSPGEVADAPIPPDVTITGINIFDRSILIDSIAAENNTLNLGYNQNFIRISYSSISFLERNSLRYFYQLEGIDKDWVTATTEQSASYTDLEPGDYTFLVKSVNREGVESKHITRLAIHIAPPWWSTDLAVGMYVLLITTLIYLLYQSRIRRIRKKQQEQLNVMIATQEEERRRISRDLHDDVGTRLTTLKRFLSTLREKAADSGDEEIETLAIRSEKFVAEAIRDVREMLLNLSPAVLDEFGFVVALETLIDKINSIGDVKVSLAIFNMDERLEKQRELALYRITQELINNVLKHADANNLSIQVGRRDQKIILMLEDDGKGFNPAIVKSGYGLRNLQSRANLLQGSVLIDSTIGKGTSVSVEIPDKQNNV